MATSIGSQPARLNGLQLLRAVAALIVVFGHGINESLKIGWAHDNFLYTFGVDLFFVLSGFIICHTSLDRFGAPRAVSRFFLTRLARIAPIYWLLTLALFAISRVVPALTGGQSAGVDVLLTSLAFIPYPSADGKMQPLNPVGWSLNFEFLFYALFALCLKFSRRTGMSLFLGALVTLVLLHPLIPTNIAWASEWTRPILLEFAAGVVIALWARAARWPSPRQSAAILLLGVSVYLAMNGVGMSEGDPLYFPLAFFAAASTVCGLTFISLHGWEPQASIAVQLGNASYSLYLIHMYVVRAMSILWLSLNLPQWPLLFLGLVVVTSAGCALISYHWIELPTYRFLKKRLAQFYNRRTAIDTETRALERG